MSAPPVRIRIGGELDQSLARSLATAQQMIGKAEKQSQREKKATTQTAEQEARKQLRAQEQLTRAADSLDRQRSRAIYGQYRAQEAAAQRAGKAQEAAAERAAKAQERAVARAQASERREVEKTIRLAQRKFEEEARQANRTAVGRGESFARRTSHRATRFLMPEAPIGPMVMRGLGDVARGAGIDFSIQGMVGRNVSLAQRAADLSNSGYQAGVAGPNGRRVEGQTLVNQARAVGTKFGIDTAEVFGALEQYQKIAGDLDTGRQSLYQMAQLAKATGTDLGDMAAATANVSNGLGDIPDKARVIDEVMRTIAGQGKLGAVEISDMATQMARIAAAASSFGGDRAKNIATFGALAQIARAEGGAPSAAESARSMGGFANTFKKAARNKEFEAITKQSAFTDKSRTTLRDPIELIKIALQATKGDQVKMNKIFMDVVGGRTVGGLSKAYVGAGGGAAGIKAVDELVSRMMKAQLSQEQVVEDAKRAANTDASKAARFQNNLDAIAESVMKNLVPALEQAGPAILKFAEVIGRVATWAIDNPKAAIATAITAAIARAGLESAFRSGIERLLLGPAGAGGAGTRAAGLGALAGQIGGVLTIAAVTVTTLQVGMAIIDEWFAGAQKDQRDAVNKGLEATNRTGEALGLERKGDLTGAKTKAEEAVKAKESELALTQAQQPGTGAKVLEWLYRLTPMGAADMGAGNTGALSARDAVLERATQQQQRELAASRALLERIATAIEKQPPPGTPGEQVEN